MATASMEIKVTPDIAAEHGVTEGRVRAHTEQFWGAIRIYRAGNFFGDVE